MGNLCGCCGQESSYEDITPSPDREMMRQQQAEAAEKRLADQEKRGIGNVDAVRRKKQLEEERERKEQEMANSNTTPGLKWQMN